MTMSMPEPTAAERARTVWERAGSATVRWLDQGASTSENEDHPARRLVVAERADLAPGRPVVAEVADAAALPVRDRILARVRLTGRAAVDSRDRTLLRIQPQAVTLEQAGIVSSVAPRDFVAAQADPFSCCEASLLSHLDTAHGEVVAALTALLDTRHLQGVVRVWPVRLDRHGLVLRLEYARRHHDTRLPFLPPAHTPDEVRARLQVLARLAARRRRACRVDSATGDRP